jgi:hypothetical protein
MPLQVFPLEQFARSDPDKPAGTSTVFYNPDTAATTAPRGDIVTLRPGDLTPEQRALVAALLRGAEAQEEKDTQRGLGQKLEMRALREADPATAIVSLFRWGDPSWQGISLRVDFTSGGQRWGLSSNIAVPPTSETFYNEQIRKGELELWPGAQAEIDRYLGGPEGRQLIAPPVEKAPPGAERPDPVLDAPVTLVWPLPRRVGGYSMMPQEVLAALQHELHRPILLDSGMPDGVQQAASELGEFHWERRPLRDLLRHFFPGWSIETENGALFLRNPRPLQERLNRLPPSVERYLKPLRRPFTLDDLTFLARSLSPWQVAKLQQYLPQTSIDQILGAQELLRLYGELAPAQRAALGQGLRLTALAPTQQALFLQFAQRQRPFTEPWRFQQGTLRLTTGALPTRPTLPKGMPHESSLQGPVSRLVFAVRFHDSDSQGYPIDLYPQRERLADRTLTDLVGQPFPFPSDDDTSLSPGDGSVVKPPLARLPVRGKRLVLVISAAAAEPYAGTQPPPASVDWTRAVANRLRGTGVTVVDLSVATREPASASAAAAIPGWLHASSPGYQYGELFDPGGWGQRLRQSPTVFVIDDDGIVCAVFEGPGAWDAAAIERAARALTAVSRAR